MRYTLVKHLGVLSEHTDGNGNRMTKELNLISWNGGKPVLDVRSWSESREHMTSGATFTESEVLAMVKALKQFQKERSI